MRHRYRNHQSKQRGVVLVEMAIVTPILLFLILATAEFSRVFIDQITLTKTVRNGARYLAGNALEGTTGNVDINDALRTESQNLVVFGNTAGTGEPVLPGLTTANVTVSNIGSNNVQITTTYAFTGIFGGVLRNLVGGADITLPINLQATVTMRAI